MYRRLNEGAKKIAFSIHKLKVLTSKTKDAMLWHDWINDFYRKLWMPMKMIDGMVRTNLINLIENDVDEWWCDTLLKHTTCLVAGCGFRNSLSLVSLPQLELSLISVVNFRDARGLEGAALLWLPRARLAFLEQTCDCICSQTLRNLRILPARKQNTKRGSKSYSSSLWQKKTKIISIRSCWSISLRVKSA